MSKQSYVIVANYTNPQHASDLIMLLEDYALDPMGGNLALPEVTKKNLLIELEKIPNAVSILCYVNDLAVGLVNCFQGFSTFRCKPLMNIHDVFIHNEYRGQGLSVQMLRKVEQIAIDRGCCKLTLEVLSNNTLAKQAYSNFGFHQYELGADNGHALFYEKALE